MAQEPSQIRDEIAETRAELAETVQALAHKADVKTRVRETVADGTAQFQTRVGAVGERIRHVTPDTAKATLQKAGTQPWLVPAVIAFVTGLLIGRRFGRSD